MKSVSGSSTISDTKLAKCSRKERQPERPQRARPGEHHLHQPTGMRAGVVAQRQLQDVFEEHRAHHLILPVRQAVGMQRHERAAHDDEKAKCHPGADQQHQLPPGNLRDARLGTGERIHDAAEQDGFDEHRRGERQIGDCQHPAQTRLASEQFEHAEVKAEVFHTAGGKTRTLCMERFIACFVCAPTRGARDGQGV
jgi:hypothetical protein